MVKVVDSQKVINPEGDNIINTIYQKTSEVQYALPDWKYVILVIVAIAIVLRLVWKWNRLNISAEGKNPNSRKKEWATEIK